ncbi:nitroreductase/quinone reductase family protein [Nocardia sp. NPDC049707]|uniref:nitroreductase/quinone reductase family protein n=1 Tax=Nocardia sp. NPDC049707 TaxID=3154735 RepID=UPI00341DED82
MTDAQPTTAADFNAAIIEEFRANAGRVGGMFEGLLLILLTTVGAKSGREHTTPVVYYRDGDRLLVFGSNGGSDAHPAWYYNVNRNPTVTVELGEADGVETFRATATVLAGAERDRCYVEQAERDPAFAAYQAGTSRVIPVIALSRERRSAIGRRGVIVGAAVAATAVAGVSAAVVGSGDADTRQAPPRAAAIGDHLRTVHEQLRRDLARVRTQLDQFREGGEIPSLPMDLRSHCVAFCGALHEHHTNEDGVFPALARQHPELAPVVERLQREHGVVAAALADLQQLLSTAEPVRLRTEFDRLANELETHFSYEEDELVATLNATDPATLRQR